MKRVIVGLLAVAVMVSMLSTVVFAAVSGAKPVKGFEPMLITNAGQGPGGKMGRLLISQSKVVTSFDYNAEPWEKDLRAKPYKTLMVIIGSSAKGLGASGITIDQEIARLNKMIAEAKKLKMQIVACQIEGKVRRGNPGSADEQSIDAIAPFADYLVVKKDANDDGRFTKISQKTKAPLTIIDDTVDFIQVIKQMYQK